MTCRTDPAYLTVAQVARRQQRSTKTILREIERGNLAAHRFGRSHRIYVADLDAYEALRRPVRDLRS